jgi:hypothetical protein
MLRAIPAAMDRDAVARIDSRLAAIALDENVVLPLAIESGSRAWGFPSPDSDYDCRFIFVRKTSDYLSLFPRRDVIETPLEDELDVNGWDLAKAIKLLLKGNAVVIEWLTSPIVYRADEAFRGAFLSLADCVADRAMIARHYLHLGERQRQAYFRDGKDVRLKKVFYALRPAAALRWLRLHPDRPVAPMHFPTLLAECEAPGGVKQLIDALIVEKAQTRELGSGPLPDQISDFIDGEYTLAHTAFDDIRRTPSKKARAAAQAFFDVCVAEYGR